jgi:hypothetical protein
MRTTEFLQQFVDGLRLALPAQYQVFETRSMGSLVKVFYGDPAIHYELWLRHEGYVEVGLHFEADKETNDRWLRHFSDRALDVIGQLGPRVEVEQWTKSWGRVHETLPFSTTDERLLDTAIKRMVAMITVLQPMLEET